MEANNSFSSSEITAENLYHVMDCLITYIYILLYIYLLLLDINLSTAYHCGCI